MATVIVKRAVKLSPLTVTEHDANHQNAADTADLALTRANAALAAGGGIVEVTHTDAIQLDVAGFGKAADAVVVQSADRTLSLGASPIDHGSYEAVFRNLGSWVVNFPIAWRRGGATAMPVGVNKQTKVYFEYEGDTNDVVYWIVPLSDFAAPPPPPPPPPQAPNNPSGLTNGTPLPTSIPFSWAASVVDGTHDAATTYQLQTRQPSGVGSFVNNGSPVSGTSASASGLTAATTTDARVRAINSGGNSAGFSNVDTATTAAAGGAFADEFTGTLDTAIVAPWVSTDGTAPPTWVYRDETGAGAAAAHAGTNAVNDYEYLVRESGSSDADMEASIYIGATENGAFPALVAAYADKTVWGVSVWCNQTNGHIMASEAGAGGFLYDTGVAIPTAGTPFRLGLFKSGASLTAYVNGVQAGASQTCVNPHTGTKIGFGVNGANRVCFFERFEKF